ncbi:MAG: glutamate-ammonia-ligase adenylyltransferase [Hydrocarboniphaga sp.]|uniref:bifunctional [glutamate--ammonia ligase]-adenylyl-L-tyrosine phosphorylase/[glutamate--ammonia-ligase] adenylyltransferase n=1 Tax=Hydrocarboniphaga sp. TaxID=2033016 RepID=UPI00263740A8|nr:bifunctional [glutamate--ammonia ligase]-adenylyl-L-tyrosine phosphorylase/[glutamate--ammonia-ligase] adenylyltransferase [Hydrocarboniphaga sp.]MDB5969464.1 glutamate-ammonia-ligase adenylyltransferase [Hydrocarboniphaga sp.]
MKDIERACAASRFLQRAVERHPSWLGDGSLVAARHAGGMAAELAAALADMQDESGVMRLLRTVREREMARIACRDLCGLAELDETLGDLSELAEVCLRAALDFALTQLRQRYGEPRDAAGKRVQPVVLGMGKLGGRELNFSSDIDLIFCHTAPGETDDCGSGSGALDNAEFFKRAAQSVTRLLSERTEHGFVFRVDLMLRPFGSAGPVSIAIDAAEDYYQEHGREWERYALIKARPVAGDIQAGLEFLRSLRPFVYRRYLDFNAIGSLRALKKLIADDVARRRQDDNVKLGTGGIRELEFIAQSFQLVRGGQEAPLRDTRLRPVLRWLGQTGYLSPETAQRLDQHYVFLRRLENAIQMYADEQTHSLPHNEEARQALCLALGFAGWSELSLRFAEVRAQVHEEFRRIFAEPGDQQAEVGLAGWLVELWNEPEGQPLAPDAAGFGDAAAKVTKALRDLRDSRSVGSLSPASQQRLQQLLPLLIEEAQRHADPALAAVRTLAVVQAIGGRSTYLTLLRESAVARDHLVRLCAASPWISQLLASNPGLLDTLLDTRALYAPPDREGIRQDLAEVLSHIPVDEVEAGMDALRRFRLETTLRIAACDVAGSLPVVQVSDRLTWLAEAVLQAAFDRAYTELGKTYGEPLRLDDTRAGLCALAYGKFGGIEMGYGSDLDLVFIHDCDAPERDTRGGERSIVGSTFMVRWAQRVIHWLATLTPAGRAYEVDLELRPSGRSGLAVVSVEGFSEYQRREAWTWEHQALTRARPVAGSPAIGARLEALRRDVLCQPRDAEKLRADIRDMRARMRAKLERREPGCWDIKQGEGGLIDIEFITQYLLLREAPRAPALVEYSDNWRQLEALTVAGVITPGDRDALIQAYRVLRAWSHARGLQQQPVVAPEDAFSVERERVSRIWSAVGL